MATDATERGVLFETFDAMSLDEVRRRGTAKWTYYGDQVLAAWVAEMDFPPADALRMALHDAVDRGFTGYPPTPEQLGLPAAVAKWFFEHSELVVDPGHIRVLPDVLRGLRLAIETFSAPQSAVVILTPAYPPFFEVVRVAEREIIEVPMILESGRPTFDLTRIADALQAGAGTVLLCNPHNPLGRVFTRDELAALAVVVDLYGARVVSDELHAPLVYPGANYVPYAAVSAAAASHSVTLVSASKGWNLPGLKCALALFTAKTDAETWDRLSFLRTGGASIMGMLANKVAFEQGEPWRREVIAYLYGNRTLLATLLAEHLPQVQYTIPEATYLAWLDCSALALENPTEFFLERAGVALSDGAGFGAPGIAHVRLNFATSRPILTMIVQHMAASLNRQ